MLRHLVAVLERLGVPYMVVGSLASAAYGEPRMTQDVDVLVDLKTTHVAGLCQAFATDEFFLSEQAALEAIRHKGQFNIIHSTSGNKIDVLAVPAGAWGRTEMARRRKMYILPNLEGYCARPEDVILGKMGYYRDGGSEKHLRDITGILKVSGPQIDRDYVSHWAEQMGLTDIWKAILRKLGA